MEPRVHGAPALFFPSFRKIRCWERIPGTADQLLLPGSVAHGSGLALACRERMTECVGEVLWAAAQGLSPSCAGKSAWALRNSCECTAACEYPRGVCGSWGSTRGGKELVVGCADFWGVGEDPP